MLRSTCQIGGAFVRTFLRWKDPGDKGIDPYFAAGFKGKQVFLFESVVTY
jgi:hypothetical protein